VAQTPGKAIEARVQERAAELYGLGLSQREAAGACGISEKSVERILRKPEYRKLADDVRRKRTSVTAQAAAVVSELLAAVDDNGEPAMGLRKMGAELVMKNPTLLESVEDVEGDDSLLPGVVLRFPWGGVATAQNPLIRGDAARAEQGFADGHESENGITLGESDETVAPPPGETLNLELDDDAPFGLRLASPVEHCEDLLPHGEHEWLDGVRRAQCPGVPEPEHEPALEETPEPEKKYDPLNAVLGGDELRANILAAHMRTPEPEQEPESEPEPVAPPTVQLPPVLGITDPATAHTRVELVEPAPLFAQDDLA
jgi:hypothetical protein